MKTLDTWVVLGTDENVGSYAHVFETDDSEMIYVSDRALVSDGKRTYPHQYTGVRVFERRYTLAEDVTEEQYLRMVRTGQEIRKARTRATEAYKNRLADAQAELRRTNVEITKTFERMFQIILDDKGVNYSADNT